MFLKKIPRLTHEYLAPIGTASIHRLGQWKSPKKRSQHCSSNWQTIKHNTTRHVKVDRMLASSAVVRNIYYWDVLAHIDTRIPHMPDSSAQQLP